MRDKDRFWRCRKLARLSRLGVRLLCSQGDRTPAAGDLTWTETSDRLTKCKALPIVLREALVHEDAYLASKYSPSLKRSFFRVIIGNECRHCTASSVHTIGNRKYGCNFSSRRLRRQWYQARYRCGQRSVFLCKSSGCWILGWKYIFDGLLTRHGGVLKYSIRDARLQFDGFPDWRTLCREWGANIATAKSVHTKCRIPDADENSCLERGIRTTLR